MGSLPQSVLVAVCKCVLPTDDQKPRSLNAGFLCLHALLQVSCSWRSAALVCLLALPKHLKPTGVPTNMPVDVLYQVFDWLLADLESTVWSMMDVEALKRIRPMLHVCRTWRGVALEMGRLVDRPVLVNPTLACTMMKAAAKHPLTLVARLEPQDFYGSRMVGAILDGGLSRVHSFKSVELVGDTAPMLLAFLPVYGLQIPIDSLCLKTSGPFGCAVLSALDGPKILRHVTRLVLHLHKIRPIPTVGSCLELFMHSKNIVHLSVGPAPFGNIVIYVLAAYNNPIQPRGVLLPSLRHLTLDGLDSYSEMGALLRWDRSNHAGWVQEMYSRMPAGINRLTMDKKLRYYLELHLEDRTNRGKSLSSVTHVQRTTSRGQMIGEGVNPEQWPQELCGTAIKFKEYCDGQDSPVTWADEANSV
jgi:hypothetical protein